MSSHVLPAMHSLEGRHVSVTLRDGSRLDDCQVVSARRSGAQTVWLFVDGIDVFLPVAAIVDCWEAIPTRDRDRPDHEGQPARRAEMFSALLTGA